MNEHLIDSVDEANRKKKEHEDKTFTKFYVHAVRLKDFGNGELYSKKGNSFIHWFDTLPYVFLNQQLFDCKYGPDRHIKFKAELERKNENKSKSDHSQATKSKKLVQCSRKLGCPAKITLKEVITFPDFRIPINNSYNKNKASKNLRVLMQQKDVTGIKKFILTLPASSEHEMHPVGEGSEIHQTMDKSIRGVYVSTNLTPKPNSTVMNEISDDEGEEVTIASRSTTQQENVSNIETENPVEQARSLSIEGAKVREMLAEIRTLSYEINDLSEMESLKNMLVPVLKYVSKKTVNQKGFTVSLNKEVKLTNKRKKSKKFRKPKKP